MADAEQINLKGSCALLAFVSGQIIPIEAVPDQAFAEKMLGDGMAIEPQETVVRAPCAGRVLQAHRGGHAYLIEAENGVRALVHVGLDTVLLKGEGFSPKVAEGQRVAAGEPLVEFDPRVLARHEKSALTILVIENSDEYPIHWRACGTVTAARDVVFKVGRGVKVSGAAVTTASDSVETAGGTAIVHHAGGFHARPGARIADVAKGFVAAVEVRAHDRMANARSAAALMGLAVDEGEQVEVTATGADAAAACAAVIAAIEAGKATQGTVSASQAAPGLPPPGAPATVRRLGRWELPGVVASPGIAVGEIFHLERPDIAVCEAGRGEAYEAGELRRVLYELAAEIRTAGAEAEQSGRRDEAAILEAQRSFVEDPVLLELALVHVGAGKSASFAWRAAIGQQCATLESSGRPLLKERAEDLRGLGQQVLRKLAHDTTAALALTPGTLLIADELAPTDFAALDRELLGGVVSIRGGPTSHASIVARAQGIPAIVAVGEAARAVPNGQRAVLDADRGVLEWRPTAERLAAAEAEVARRRAHHTKLQQKALAPAYTADGVLVEVAANVSTAAEVREAVAFGADAVGLLRTELLFMGRKVAPTEAEQQAAYQEILDALGGRTVVIRTLDVGADKPLDYVAMPREDNPALGVRGIRLGLSRQELLREQLRACLRLQPRSSVRVMLPMVTDVAEVLEARAVLESLSTGLGTPPIELGVMIETPSAALLAEQLAAEADFLSIGTNDLTQYTLAIDRGNAALAARLDHLHPAVLHLIALTSAGGAQNKKVVSVCGAMASDPVATPLLLGFGIRKLSVSPAVVPEIKAIVRRLALGTCREAAQAALKLRSADAVRLLARQTWKWLDSPPSTT